MVYISTLTSKGQATIPLPIRQLLDLVGGDKVAFTIEHDRVLLKPAKSFLDLKGSVKARRKYSNVELDRLVSQAATDQYQKKQNVLSNQTG